MRKCIILLGLAYFMLLNRSSAQQYMLYNTRTLYDAFENPSQKAFRADSSRQYAFNFIPAFSVNGSINGPANDYLASLIFKGKADLGTLDIEELKPNITSFNANMYLASFRIFTDVQFDQELGFSWQVRNDSRGELTNGLIVLENDANYLREGKAYNSILNNYSYSQSYHQLSFTYRKNHIYNRRLGWGFKLSYLSGITYNELKISDSYVRKASPDLYVRASGRYRATHPREEFMVNKNSRWPNFVNPGFSFTLSANLRLRKGWYLLGNLKDVGFISWNKDSYEYTPDVFNLHVYPSGVGPSALDQLGLILDKTLERKGFVSLTNGKLEAVIGKDMGNYQPSLIVSKNLFYSDGDIVWVNNFHLNSLILTASAGYNPNTSLQIGGQIMVYTPNFEFYIGSEQPFKSYQSIKGGISGDVVPGMGYIGGSIYLGLGIKFGRVMYHRSLSPYVPVFK